MISREQDTLLYLIRREIRTLKVMVEVMIWASIGIVVLLSAIALLLLP